MVAPVGIDSSGRTGRDIQFVGRPLKDGIQVREVTLTTYFVSFRQNHLAICRVAGVRIETVSAITDANPQTGKFIRGMRSLS